MSRIQLQALSKVSRGVGKVAIIISQLGVQTQMTYNAMRICRLYRKSMCGQTDVSGHFP